MVCDKLREIPLTQKHGISLSYLAFILLCIVVQTLRKCFRHEAVVRVQKIGVAGIEDTVDDRALPRTALTSGSGMS